MFLTPVLLIVFNRPDLTQQVLDRLQEVGVKNLFVVADGPRNDNSDDEEKCRLTRETVEKISWECNFKTLFRNENVGCGKGPSEGISWFFDQVEEGIILEDDCLPSISFFRFCAELLEKYRFQDDIMHISGNYFLGDKLKTDDSYYFSALPNAWGWATWRRAWQKFDFGIHDFPEFEKTKKIQQVFKNISVRNYWIGRFRMTFRHPEKVNWWDYQWFFAVWNNNGKAIAPTANLVSNIGFRDDASHTKDNSSYFSNLPALEIKGVIVHPLVVELNTSADRILTKELNLYNIEIQSNIKFKVLYFLSYLKSKLIKSKP
jgi:hypothetical protein